MPLQATLTEAQFNELPEEAIIGKNLFVKNEKDGVYYLNMDGSEAGKLATPLRESIKKLETNNEALLDEKVRLMKERDAFTGLGKTPEELEKILKEGATPDTTALEAEYQKKLKSLQETAEQKMKALEEQVKTGTSEKEELMNQFSEEKKRAIIAELRSKYEMNALGSDYLANRIRIVRDDNGKFQEQVVENGEVAYKAANPKTPIELVEEARANPELAGMFNAGTGGGSGGGNRQRKTASGFVKADDFDALGANLEDIASGKIKVVGS